MNKVVIANGSLQILAFSTPELLLGIMQQLYFGKIEGLTVRNSEPCFKPPPQITQEIKLCAQATRRPVSDNEDFHLKRCVIELFGHINTLSDGSVVTIEVRHGLPARLIVTRSV